ncbi:MAG: MBL fold metallo-hydrolase, partial [Lachnoanaerobaculum sp.]|nr:MBL fold metallo-hydrolase [Lachnoanaerobaculum sp.]
SRLEAINLSPKDIDCVLLTHLDFENVSGVADLSSDTKILVSRDEAKAAVKNPLRYSRSWWKNADISIFDWNQKEGPFEKSFDLLGDVSIKLIKLYGHSAGMFGVKVTSENNKFTLLYADAGYGELAWKELTPPAISVDKEASMRSLEWVRTESMDKNCAYSLASHESTSLKVLRF